MSVHHEKQLLQSVKITNMIKQPPSNAYMPKSSHTYYPIQPKKPSNDPQVPTQTLRVDKIRQREIDTLRKAYEQLKERQEIYIDKLMKLEQGLQNQHSEFIKLQELYTELFQSYKQKQSEIIELQMKFRQSDRYRQQQRQSQKGRQSFRFNDSRMKQYSFREKEWSSKQQQWQGKEMQWMKKEKTWFDKQKQLSEHIDNLKKKIAAISESYQKVVQQFSHYKTKEKANSNKSLSEKTMNELQEWQKQINGERETRLKFQYENQFLKNRNNDLETQRQELEKLLAFKQKEINKLREQKIKIHRQSSQKSIQRSPGKSNKKTVIKITEVQAEQEKQIRKELSQSGINANESDQTQRQKYFSFSRDRHNNSMDSELPSFPPELQIDSLITEHKK